MHHMCYGLVWEQPHLHSSKIVLQLLCLGGSSDHLQARSTACKAGMAAWYKRTTSKNQLARANSSEHHLPSPPTVLRCAQPRGVTHMAGKSDNKVLPPTQLPCT